MLDPVWLRSFVSVAQTLSFTAAAARLGIRQSTVSDHVRKLEASLARRIFARDTHSVALTADGEALLAFAASILDANERALRHFSNEELYGRLRLGVSEDVVLSGLPRVLREFVKSHPRVDLELTVGVSETVRGKLDQGLLDLAVVKRHAGDARGRLLWSDTLVWAASRDFRLAVDRPIPLVVLAPPALTRTAALSALERQGLRWRIISSSDSQSGVHAAAFAGLGIAPHARSLLPSGLVEFEHKLLPALGETEFATLARRGAPASLVEAMEKALAGGGFIRHLPDHALDFRADRSRD